MGLRYSSKGVAIALAGTTFTHGITINGVSQAPDEWSINLRGPTPGAAVLYVVGTPSSASIVVAASGAAGTGDVFASLTHTIIR